MVFAEELGDMKRVKKEEKKHKEEPDPYVASFALPHS